MCLLSAAINSLILVENGTLLDLGLHLFELARGRYLVVRYRFGTALFAQSKLAQFLVWAVKFNV